MDWPLMPPSTCAVPSGRNPAAARSAWALRHATAKEANANRRHVLREDGRDGADVLPGAAKAGPARGESDPGDTLLFDGRPAVVLHLLPKLPGRRPAVRAAFDLPCGACEAPLRYDAPRRQWRCSGYSTVYDREALADVAREHLQDGTKVGKARR